MLDTVYCESVILAQATKPRQMLRMISPLNQVHTTLSHVKSGPIHSTTSYVMRSPVHSTRSHAKSGPVHSSWSHGKKGPVHSTCSHVNSGPIHSITSHVNSLPVHSTTSHWRFILAFKILLNSRFFIWREPTVHRGKFWAESRDWTQVEENTEGVPTIRISDSFLISCWHLRYPYKFNAKFINENVMWVSVLTLIRI